MATEEANYEVVRKSNIFEIRDYSPHIIAETVLEGSLEDAGSKAFKILFGYISGKNRSRLEIEMTATVSQQVTGEQIQLALSAFIFLSVPGRLDFVRTPFCRIIRLS